MQLARLRSPLVLKSIGTTVNGAPTEVKEFVACCDRQFQRFPIEQHIDA
jgi:hypothetical protein